MKNTFWFFIVLVVSMACSSEEDVVGPLPESEANVVKFIVRPATVDDASAFILHNGATIIDCVRQSYTQGPAPVGDGTDTSFIEITANSARGFTGAWDKIPIPGIITEVHARVVHQGIASPGPPPPPYFWDFDFVDDNFDPIFGGVLTAAGGIHGDVTLLEGEFTGLSIPTENWNAAAFYTSSLAFAAPGPLSQHFTWSIEIEFTVIPAIGKRNNKLNLNQRPGLLP